MPNRNYIKGSNAERERCKWHYEHGAIFATRSAGSHSSYDVIAVYKGRAWGYDVFFEQLKSKKADARNVKLPLMNHFLGGAVDGSSVLSRVVLRKKGGGWQIL